MYPNLMEKRITLPPAQTFTRNTTMKAPRITKLLAAGALCLSSTAFADSISPTSFSATLGVGDSTTIHKTVTVTAGTPTSSKVDVFFLADTTGSMGSVLSAVQSSAASIMSSAAGLG